MSGTGQRCAIWEVALTESLKARLSALLAIICALLLVSTATSAEESETGHHSKYAIAGFVGATNVHGENEFTLGIEGGFNFHPNWSVGLLFERAERDRHSSLWLVGLGWHPFGPALRFQAGLGRKDPSGEHETVFRTAIGYELELENRCFLKPYIAADFIENEDNETIFGVYIGRGF